MLLIGFGYEIKKIKLNKKLKPVHFPSYSDGRIEHILVLNSTTTPLDLNPYSKTRSTLFIKRQEVHY